MIGIDPGDWGVSSMLERAGFDPIALPAGGEDGALVPDAALALVRCDDVADRASPLAGAARSAPAARTVVVATGACDAHVIREWLAAGACGVVAEATIDACLVPTLEAVLAGQVCVPAADAEALRQPVLSFREKQVLELAARGQTNAQIATQLFLAESTIKSHLYTAFRKLGVRSRTEAAALVLDPEMWARLGMAVTGAPGAVAHEAS